ncbi:MAG TPA: glutamate formimidoyltransferase [candidate division Zixibacteria bacterium]|nr:glutamate formimidoyltransferase [candidate division Zixibacteria bacterium]
MPRIIECIPNFSEGRRPDVVRAIADAISSVESAKILDIHSDIDHNRSVITYVCEPEHAVESGFWAYRKAAELIDMTKHEGVHPRIGACDVFPMVPLEGVTIDEAIQLTHELGRRVGKDLQIPVYLYEYSAKSEERKNLANIRRGQYEELTKTIAYDLLKSPDFGPCQMNLKSGATAIGVRGPLIAFNVFLDSQDKSIAKKIANAISESKGGFKFVKALGFEIKSKNQVQVSMNLTDYTKTPLHRVFETIKSEADRYGVNIASSEIVGLIPFDAAADIVNFYLRLTGFTKEKVFEERLGEVLKISAALVNKS